MDRAMEPLAGNVSSNLQHSFALEQTNEEQVESFECFVDNLSFRCVWQQPDVNMHIINQFMEEINIYDSNEYGDFTPCDVLALLSSSFPSGPFNDETPHVVDEKPGDLSFTSTFISSTPVLRDSNDLSGLKRRQDALDFQFLANVSPILYSKNKDKLLLTRKRLQMSFESDVDENTKKVIKI